jgi:deoxyxylulose-5-phosphate synthase
MVMHMKLEQRVTRDMDSGHIRNIERIAEDVSRFYGTRKQFTNIGFDYINSINGDQGQYRQKYARLFLDMIREYDVMYKVRKK